MARKTQTKSNPLIEKEYYENFEFIDPISKEKRITKVKVIKYVSKIASSEEDDSKDEMIEMINTKISSTKNNTEEEI